MITFGARRGLAVHLARRGQQANQYTRERGMNASFEHHDPCEDSDGTDRQPRHTFAADQHVPDGGAHGDADEPIPGVERGEEHGDQNDGEQIVNRRKCHQKCPDRAGQRLGEQGENRQGERDIGRGRNRPTVGGGTEWYNCAGCDGHATGRRRGELRIQANHRHEQDGRNQHASHRAQHRDGGGFGIRERASGQLLFQIKPDHKEEDGQQAVLRPVADWQHEISSRNADGVFGHRFEAVHRPRQIRQQEAKQGESEHNQAGYPVRGGNAPDSRPYSPVALCHITPVVP